MSKLMSEVLFNQALLWLLIGWEESRGGENKWMAFVYFMASAFSIVRSIQKRMEGDW